MKATKKQNQEILKVLEGKIDRIEVGKILNKLKSIPTNEICDELGDLDLKKFHARQEVKDTIKKLKQLGVTREYLRKHFIVASLTIGRLL